MAIEVDTLINSFFTSDGVPADGLTPTIDIWTVTPTSHTKVIDGESMIEIGEGLYKYNFTTYDTDIDYVVKVDGGGSLSGNDRYQASGNESFKEDIADAVLDETVTDHLSAGSLGFVIAATQADTTALRIDVDSAIILVQTLLKYESNRTKIDKLAKTLTVFDDDGLTPLQVFDLLDGTGSPSVDEVAERVPQ